MGFKPSEDLTTDPFASDNDSNSISEEDESNQTSDHHAEISFTLYFFFFFVCTGKEVFYTITSSYC